MSIPKIMGLVIKPYTKYSNIPIDSRSFDEFEYSTTLDPQEYDEKKYWYKLFCKIFNPETSHYLFLCATIYRGNEIAEGTVIASLEDTRLKLLYPNLSQKDQETFCENKFKKVNIKSPSSDQKQIYYCDFDIDYHYEDIWFRKGTVTINLRLGTGKVSNKVEAWLPSQQFQWNITG